MSVMFGQSWLPGRPVICFFLLVAVAFAHPAAAQTVVSAEDIVAAAQRSSLHRNTVAARDIGRLGLQRVDIGNGITMQLGNYLQQSGLDRTLRINRLRSPNIVGRLLRTQPRIDENISQLADRIVVDRRVRLDLVEGACRQRDLPKSLTSVCFRPKRGGKLSSEIRNELASIRAKLARRKSNDLVRPGLTVRQARALSDRQLLDRILNSGRKEIRHVSVLPLASVARLPAGARPQLSRGTFNFNRRMRPPRRQDFRLRPGMRLETTIPTPNLRKSDPTHRPRPAEPTIDFPERHFLAGFTFGHAFSDTFEFTLAEESWATDRYFVRFSYELSAGFGFRVPVGIDVVAKSAVRILDDNVRTVAEREARLKRKKPGRNVTLTARAVDVDRYGHPSYGPARLPANQTFGGDEFVLGISAGCSFHASIPGPDISYSCPLIGDDASANFKPPLGPRQVQLDDFWISGKTLGLGYGISQSNGAWLDIGVLATMRKGRVGFRITPKNNTTFGNLRSGSVWRDSRKPMRFVVRHRNVERSSFTDKIGFTISEPRYAFKAQLTPQARLNLNLDIGIYALSETIGPFALDFLSIEEDFVFGRHEGTVNSYDFPM